LGIWEMDLKRNDYSINSRQFQFSISEQHVSRAPLLTGHEEFKPPSSYKAQIYQVFHGGHPSSKYFQMALVFLICCNTILFAISTLNNVSRRARRFFDLIEMVTVVLFTIEYVLRLWTITENPIYVHPFFGRLKYLISFPALIDISSILPFYLTLMMPAKGVKWPMMTWLRALRVFKILEVQRYKKAIGFLYDVIRINREVLGIGTSVAVLLLLMTATVLYFVRPPNDEEFSNVFQCMYLAILMLTGQGIPDTPDGGFPLLTKFAIAITALFSVAIFALPAAVLAYGFEVEADRLRHWKAKNKRLRAKCEKAGIKFVPIQLDEMADSDDDEAPSTSSSTNTSTPASSVTSPMTSPRAVPMTTTTTMTTSSSSNNSTCVTCPHCSNLITLSIQSAGVNDDIFVLKNE